MAIFGRRSTGSSSSPRDPVVRFASSLSSEEAEADTHFMLDEGARFEIDERASLDPRWRELTHSTERERSLMMIADESLCTCALLAPREPTLWLRCMRGLPKISQDGLDVELSLLLEGGIVRSVAKFSIYNSSPRVGLHELTMALPVLPGEVFRLVVRCGAGPLGQPEADWLALCGLVVCASEEVSQWRARSQYGWRLQNEIAHFTSVYRNSFYEDRQALRGGAVIEPMRALPEPDRHGIAGQNEALAEIFRARVADLVPWRGENAFSFTHRALTAMLNQKAPDFAARLSVAGARAQGRPIRLLALCAGEAAIEAGLIEQAGVPVEVCIVDVNESMLERAGRNMPANTRVDCVLGNANSIGLQLGKFDVVVITSGLHHLVELEQVLSAIAGVLGPDGEFWLIGEQVGRNGNRLWPEGRAEAERIFSQWPAEKRRNANTGEIDFELPDRDFSSGCFEGIRSQEILELLARHFLPADVYIHDAFLWRLVDVAYAGNFDAALPQDRELLLQAALTEAVHWTLGGRGTSLHAVYRSKQSEVIHSA